MNDGSDTTEKLEQRVAELEATVRGLTEELVDATERIRTLEREAGMHDSPAEKREQRDRSRVTPESTDAEAAQGDTTKSEDTKDSEETGETTADDIIVA